MSPTFLPNDTHFDMWVKKNTRLLKKLNTSADDKLLLFKYFIETHQKSKKKYAQQLFIDACHIIVEYQYCNISMWQRRFRLSWKQAQALCWKLHKANIITFNGYDCQAIKVKSHNEVQILLSHG